MLVALRTIGIDNAYIFHHAVKVDHTIRGTPKDAGHAIVERFLIYGFFLQQLPATAMQDMDIGHPEADVLCDERFYEVLPKNVSETINQHGRRTLRFCKTTE